ncbi:MULTISPECIES: Crp/Fnr family transcriptional regulator [unclassified Paenibacillus]|uniref:Crp/Fnr family transcriptional regulator n=1 Tax=unclassified Paenibacillus TaxID=185978 RepID=UPI001AE47AD7|nr:MULTISPECIES: Crp/Fnr family transcriptional regulator [unclassified Paenibacillus]MBP1153716.1 CRP/FNR family transcriptional regulator [Paenibacillus sp. PvP091]MBP1170899.1 CRP/FNR family transcriptional regulator [Paenibacillus sp. PvR098]MBP2441927.1 CRP/FNR family transcriptional regulator [Paenibacillus sp. PvP052]
MIHHYPVNHTSEAAPIQSQGLQQYFTLENVERLTGIMYSKKVQKGSGLFWEGDKAEYLYYIKQGRVKITKSADNGGSLTLYLHHVGDLIGYGDGMTDSAYLLGAEAIEDCDLGLIQRKDLEVLLWQHGDLAVEFMRWQGMMHLLTQTKFRDLMMFGKPGALCSLLIRLNNSYGEPFGEYSRISVKLNNTEMSEMIGATRESVNRMLSDLKKQNTIDIVNGHFIIKDLAYLRDICHCENCPKHICRV